MREKIPGKEIVPVVANLTYEDYQEYTSFHHLVPLYHDNLREDSTQVQALRKVGCRCQPPKVRGIFDVCCMECGSEVIVEVLDLTLDAIDDRLG